MSTHADGPVDLANLSPAPFRVRQDTATVVDAGGGAVRRPEGEI